MRLIVGLGNPGREYERTRHNMGWFALDSLAKRLNATAFRREGQTEIAEARSGEEKIYLMKPQTFMNLSGRALASWFGKFKEIPDELREEAPAETPLDGKSPTRDEAADDKACLWPRLLVVADDVNLPLGRMRFRPSGSAGGHNGLKDIEKALGGVGYPRLRLGVGQPPGRMDRIDYVLARFGSEEVPLVLQVADNAAAAIEDWIRLGMPAVRQRYNGRVLGEA